MPVRIEQRVAQVGKARIYYELAEIASPAETPYPQEKPAVVLLHGLSGSSRWWSRNTPVLAERFRVYAIDLIGFGRSRGQPFVLEETAGVIAEWMGNDEVGSAGVFHLVGHSMGGLVAAELAALRPKQVDRLVLVDVATLPPGRTLYGSALRLVPAVAYMPLDFLPVLVTDALRAGPLTLLRASYAIHHAHLVSDLVHVAARTLIVWGEHDTLLSANLGRELHESLPGSQFAILRGAGHNPMWDRAAEFNKILMEFLTK